MAKGRPDWTSSINITGQDLAEVIERPKYGAAEDAYGNWAVLESQEQTPVSIAGTGMIYGGYIWVTGSFDPALFVLNVEIDGQSLRTFSIQSLNEQMVDGEATYHFYEKYYSEETDIYSIGLMKGITFEESWAFKADNRTGSGAQAVLYSTVIYALI